jgi:hypothetical protein
MAKRRISRRELLTFLEANEEKLYKKYKDVSEDKMSDMKDSEGAERTAIHTLLAKYAIHHHFLHGDVIEFLDSGHRNRGILFWDAMKGKVIQPSFDHEEATLPEQFIVGDGFFNPSHWDKSLGYAPLRPCKALLKELKNHFSKSTTPMEVIINGQTYKVKLDGYGWDDFNWSKLMLVYGGKTLSIPEHFSAEAKGVNEEKLRAFLNGDTVKRNMTRKLDLEAKLAAAEKRFEEAQAEVYRLRKELEGVGNRGTRRV